MNRPIKSSPTLQTIKVKTADGARKHFRGHRVAYGNSGGERQFCPVGGRSFRVDIYQLDTGNYVAVIIYTTRTGNEWASKKVTMAPPTDANNRPGVASCTLLDLLSHLSMDIDPVECSGLLPDGMKVDQSFGLEDEAIHVRTLWEEAMSKVMSRLGLDPVIAAGTKLLLSLQ